MYALKHYHAAFIDIQFTVPNLIWKQVASSWVSKFESLIKVIQMKITGCESPDLRSTLGLKRLGCFQLRHSEMSTGEQHYI